MSKYDTLNEKQREAVFTTNGPLLLLAGAGSGKTRVLTHRIAYLIENGISPYSILAITFTNKAAREMKERTASLCEQGESVWISTFHSTCVRILRREIEHLRYDSNFTIYDTDDQTKLIKECLKELSIDEKAYPPKMIISKIGEQKDNLITAEAFAKLSHGQYFEETIAKVYTLYQNKLYNNNALDFDDIIFKTVELFKKHPEVLEKYQDRFLYIMVDEYQDTNSSQYELVRLLAFKNRNLCVVGDDDQSIYGWRGANISNILDFEKHFNGAKVIKLEENYRSTQNILNAANIVVKNNRTRKDKTLFTSNKEGEKINHFKAGTDFEEGTFIAEKIKEEVVKGKKYSDFAILYRTNSQSRSIEDKLVRLNIPYRLFGGTKFYDRKEIKDILSYLKLIHNTFDSIYLKRIINVPKRGIGDATVDKLVSYSLDYNISIYDALSDLEHVEGLGNRTKGLKDFAELIDYLIEYSQNNNVSDLIEEVISKTEYISYLNLEGPEEAQKRIENINELINKANEFMLISEDKSLSAFLEEVSLVADIDGFTEDDDTVVLMTLHSSKGLEFPTVFIAGFEDGLFPSFRSLEAGDREIEEERRLCYVGITRARENLYFTSTNSRMSFGKIIRNPISRFYKEIPSELIQNIGIESNESESRDFAFGQQSNINKNYKDSINRVNDYIKQNSTKLNDKPLDFTVGDDVRQMKYGVGTVVEIKPAGADFEVSVEFPAHGVKKFMAHLSKLKKA